MRSQRGSPRGAVEVGLRRVAIIQLPTHSEGGFEHADVHLASGRVFVAHTANGTIDVIDGKNLRWQATLLGCPDGTGLICAQEDGLVFAASGARQTILVIEPTSLRVIRELPVGPRPAGLAWDPMTRRLLNVDLGDYRFRLLESTTGKLLVTGQLPGRPRWPVWDPINQRFLVNIREPSSVALLDPTHESVVDQWYLTEQGAHGLDLDPVGRRAFVACDSGVTVILDLADGHQLGSVPIGGEPDVIWFNPKKKLLYVAIGDPGELDVIDPTSMSMAQRIKTASGAHTTAFDRSRQLLYVLEPDGAKASVFKQT